MRVSNVYFSLLHFPEPAVEFFWVMGLDSPSSINGKQETISPLIAGYCGRAVLRVFTLPCSTTVWILWTGCISMGGAYLYLLLRSIFKVHVY